MPRCNTERRYYRQTLLCWILFVLFIAPSAPAQRYTFSTYGMASGLSNLNVLTLIEDRSGMIWAGTESGVFTGDGLRFHKQEGFVDAGFKRVSAMLEDGEGRVWAMDNRHLAYWERGVVHTIASPAEMPHPAAGLRPTVLNAEDIALVALPLEPNAIYLLRDGVLLRIASQDHGQSWQGSAAFPGAALVQHPELQKLTSVVSGGGSTLWAGCGGSICKLNLLRGTIAIFGEREGVKSDVWRSLLLSRKGSLWARGEKRVLTLSAGATSFTEAGHLPATTYLNVEAAALVEDPAGNIVLNLAHGIASTNGSSWHIYGHNNGLPEDEVDALLFDHTGGLWITPLGHGISRWRGYGNWEGWTRAEGLSSDVVWAVPRDRAGHVWVVTETNLDRLDPATSVIVPQDAHFPFHRLLSAIVDRRQHVWTGDELGQVIDFDPRTGRARVAASELGRIYKLLLDRQQRVWVCSRKGVRYFSPNDQWSVMHTIEKKDMPESFAWSIAEGKNGSLWVTTGNGLFRLQGDTWTAIHTPFLDEAHNHHALASAPDGTLWIQSKLPFPILHFRIDGNTATVIDKVSEVSIGTDNINTMQMDQRGWLWVGTDDGLDVFDGKQWVQCTEEDGLLWDDTDFGGLSADPDGSVWVGTSGGLSHLLHPERMFAVAPPLVHLAYARLGDLELHGATNPEFDLRKPTLTVGIFNTSYSRGSAIVYRYKLDGQENKWQETEGGSLRFPTLNPGIYKLSLVAYDRRLHASSEPMVLSFTVLEPWWNRGWFRTLEGLGILLCFWGLRHYSIHLLMRRQQELETLVASRTEELESEKTELLSTRSALIEMTRRDALTGLLNRAAIFERMRALSDQATETGEPLAVAMADLDSFKSINDRYGHVAGDTVLRECAARVAQAIRPGDLVGRYGGEELLILMPGLQPASAAARMEELRVSIAGEPIRHEELFLTVTCSFGVAWTGDAAGSLEALVGFADEALYLAKYNGRNRVEYAVRECREEALAPV